MYINSFRTNILNIKSIFCTFQVERRIWQVIWIPKHARARHVAYRHAPFLYISAKHVTQKYGTARQLIWYNRAWYITQKVIDMKLKVTMKMASIKSGTDS